MREFFPAFVALAAGLGACTSHLDKMPTALGDCMPGPEAGCSSSNVGGGSSTGPGATGPGTDDDSGTVVAGCGIADTHVVTQVTSCRPCIIQRCCDTDIACNGACPSLLDCTQTCAVGDMICLGNCENTWAGGVSAYQQFAQCLTMNCSPECPTLQPTP